MTPQRIDFIGSKIAKKKRISPSAKRRSRYIRYLAKNSLRVALCEFKAS